MKQNEEIRKALFEKFGNYEATPQDSTWEQIRAGLLSENLRQNLSEKFDTFEATPLDSSWEVISETIHKKEVIRGILTEKFDDFEVEANPRLWANIQSNLSAEKGILAQKMNDYEPEPTAQSWEVIRKAIQKEDKRRGVIIPLFYRVGIAAGVALLVGIFWFMMNQNSEQISTTKSADNQPITPKLDSITEPKIQPNLPLIVKPNNLAVEQPIPAKKKLIRKRLQKTEFALVEISTEKNFAQNSETKSAENVEPISTEKDQSKLNSSELNLLKTADYQLVAIEKPLPKVDFELEAPIIELPKQKTNNLIFSANLMPVQTYQVYTILPQTSTYVHQIGSLSPIDNQRLGVQAKFGVMKPISRRNIVGVSLNYTGIQQYTTYDVSNGNYEVNFDDSGNYNVSVLTQNIIDKQFTHAVGLRADNSYLVAQKKNRVYLTGGGEAMRLINKNQYGFYLNASIGVEYRLDKRSFWLEPTFRYSLSQSSDNLNYLKIRPYQVGFNIRYNFGS